MFAPSSRGAFVCLRCQTRLARQQQQRFEPTRILQGTRIRRWQSTATAKLEDEGDYEDSQADHAPARPGPPLKHNREHKYRKWRPSPVEQLGVPALGKPAEVLVLPSRDRKIPIVPSDDNDSQQKVQESLDAELQPLSQTQVKANIEQLREQFRHKDGHLAEAEWKKLRNRLAGGFTRNQLAKYIDQMKGPKAPKLKSSSKTWKPEAASYILDNIWGCTFADARVEDAENITRGTIQVSRHHLDVMLLHPSRPLQQLSEANNVQVDVFREQRRIVLSGNAAHVSAAKGAFAKLRDSIKKSPLRVPDTGQDIRQWKEEEAQKFIRMIKQRHGVHINLIEHPDRPGVDIYHLNDPPSVGAVRRDMLLYTKKPDTIQQQFAWPLHGAQPKFLVPVYPSNELHPSQAAVEWARYRQLSASSELRSIAKFDEEEKIMFGNMYKTIRDYLRYSPSPQLLTPSSNIREEFTAHFGQALVDRRVRNEERKENFEASTATFFIPRIPLLPQFVSSIDSLKREIRHLDHMSPNEPTSNPFFFFRIKLTPAQIDLEYPVIEVFLTGKDATLGLKQTLQVQSVQAVLESRTTNLFLPGLAVDVQFIRQAKVDLYTAGGKQQVVYAQTLKQLGKFLHQAEGQAEPTFPLFTRLNLPEDILRDQGTVEHVTAGEGRSKNVNGSSEAIEYLLEAAEVVNFTTFRPRISTGHESGQLYLNDVTADGGVWGSDSRSFSLAGQPLFTAPPAKGKVKFVNLFNTAYEVALQLGKLKLIEG